MSDRFTIGVGMLHQESNSFNSRLTVESDLDTTTGAEVIQRWRGTGMPLGGALEVLERSSAKLVGLVAAAGASGGPLQNRACREISEGFVSRCLEACPDAVYLDLHGALVSESAPDVSGKLLRNLRQALPEDSLIAVILDSHANLTEEIANCVDVLVGFKTYPHQDYDATGSHAARLLLRTLSREIRPTIRVVKIPMIQAPETSDTFRGPLAPLVEDLNKRRSCGEILDGTLFYAQPWLDIPFHGSSVAITTDSDPCLGEELAHSTAKSWWQKRTEFTPSLWPPADAINEALRHPAPTIILSESGDAINSGAVGDNPTLVRALVEASNIGPAVTFTCDPALLRQIEGQPEGSECQVTFGEATDRRFGDPFSCTVAIERRVAGRFRLKGKYFNGLEQDMGGAAVLRAGSVRILAARRPVICSEPALYRCAGLEPSEYKVVGIKSPSSFRPNFEVISTVAFTLDMRGASSPNLRTMPWAAVKRPLFPLDQGAPYEVLMWKGRRQ